MWRTLKNSFLKSKAKGNDRLPDNERAASFRVLRILHAVHAEDYLLHFQPFRLAGRQRAMPCADADGSLLWFVERRYSLIYSI